MVMVLFYVVFDVMEVWVCGLMDGSLDEDLWVVDNDFYGLLVGVVNNCVMFEVIVDLCCCIIMFDCV